MILETVEDYIKARLVHSVHTSERRSHRGCRRRHNWVFREGYYPYTTVKPLEFGVAFHKGMEKLYDPLTWDDKELAYNLARAAFVQVCEDQFKAFKKAVETGKVSGFIDMTAARQDYDDRRELGLGMLRHYYQRVMPEADKFFKPVKVEIEFEVPIAGPDGEMIWCKCDRCWKRYKSYALQNMDVLKGMSDPSSYLELVVRPEWQGLPVTYGGRIDMLAQDNLGRYWVVDWKTAARLATGEPGADDDFMWMDDQITSYCWAMWVMGFPIAGFVYVEIKKVAPEEPEPLQRPYKGRMYPVNKQTVTATYDQYLDTVKENDPTAYANGLYDEFLDYLKESVRFHLRHEIHRSDAELRSAGYNIWLEAQEMTDPNSRIYPSKGRFSCSGCAFWEPCLSKDRGEDYQYTLDTMYEKRERHYFEIQSSTDKPMRA